MVHVQPLASDAFRFCSTRGPSSNFSRLLFASKISDKHSAPGSKNDWYGYIYPETAIRVEEADDQPSNFGCAIFRAIP